jgi:endonuclease/exonuclease/phosphatase family metal-dependent hydrolase
LLLLKMLKLNEQFTRRGAAMVLAAALAGCASFPADRIGLCTRAPVVTQAGDNRRGTEISVLTYNVEGLPWPVRKGRAPRLREIGRQLAAMRAAGTAPDIVLLQEAFSGPAALIGKSAGYPNFVRGPTRGMKRPPTSEEAERALVGNRRKGKGEGLRQFMPSGLYILSDFPIVVAERQPFRARECAGFDCLSNKGLLYARIAVPGVPDPLEIFNTHLNSRGSTGVSEQRSLLAHQLQIDESSRFIEGRRDPGFPLVFGGDFNMRNARDRFKRFALQKPWPIVHQWCLEPGAKCDVRLSWDGDTPWMDTQDLQGFDSGARVSMRPIRVDALFDEPWKGRPLSDHDGLLVVYRLTWPAGPGEPDTVQSPCSSAPPDRLAGG